MSNQYLEHHDQKLVADERILRAEAAHKYWKKHDFDILNCRYYDQKKEDAFVVKRGEDALTHGCDEVKKLPLTVQNEGLMYNPVSMKIEDAKRLQILDLK